MKNNLYKVVKCPQCRSVKNTRIRRDKYNCNNCGIYFIINETENKQDAFVTEPKSIVKEDKSKSDTHYLKKIKIRILLPFLLSFLSSILFLVYFLYDFTLFKEDSVNEIVEKKIKKTYTPFLVVGFESWNKQAMICTFVKEKSYVQYEDEKNQLIYGIIDATNGDTIVMRGIQGIEDIKNEDDIKIKQFTNGRVYFIFNKKNLYELDTKTFEFIEINLGDYSNNKKFEIGINQIFFINEKDANGFYLLMNNGERYKYYPIINQLNEDNNSFVSLTNPSVKTGFIFTGLINSNSSTERKFLIKYSYKQQDGYSTVKPKFTVNDPNKKPVNISSFFTNKEARLIQFSNVLEEYYFFSTSIINYNEEYVLFRYKPSLADDVKHKLQLLDVNSLQTVWDIEIEDQSYLYSKAVILDKVILLIAHNGKFCLIDKMQGKIIYYSEKFEFHSFLNPEFWDN